MLELCQLHPLSLEISLLLLQKHLVSHEPSFLCDQSELLFVIVLLSRQDRLNEGVESSLAFSVESLDQRNRMGLINLNDLFRLLDLIYVILIVHRFIAARFLWCSRSRVDWRNWFRETLRLK